MEAAKEQEKPAAPVRILFQDKWLVVCVKPVGMLSEAGGMPELLSAQCGGRIDCVHRLDKQVGGVMVYARDSKTAAKLSAAIAGHEVEKTYLAAVEGTPDGTQGEMRDLLFHDSAKNKSYVVDRMRKGVREAVLNWTLLSRAETDGKPLSLCRVLLGTGRSHQIRVQFSHRKMPLIGDKRYGAQISAPQIGLWSARLRFTHPVTGKKLCFTALPEREIPWRCFGEISLPED